MKKTLSQKSKIIRLAIGVIIVAVIMIFCHAKSPVKLPKPMEEVYAPQVDGAINKKEQGNVPQAPTPEMVQAEALLLQEKQKELQQRLAAPLMAVENKLPAKDVEASSASSSHDPNTQFFNQVAAQSIESVTATKLGSFNLMIAEGSFIHATLESAADSDLPGYLRAIVSQPSYSEDGSHLLIPVGSRLIGQYKSELRQGQARFFIVWTRLITPQGMSVSLGSPGVDSLGMAGMQADEINRHFWQQFGTASLLSLLGTGVSSMPADPAQSASVYRAAVANSLAQSADASLQQNATPGPTLKTYQGKPIMVFVARDLHFPTNTLPTSSIPIF